MREYWKTGAVFSLDRKYRYLLWRQLQVAGRRLNFVCLNPSTANEKTDDPTVRRLVSLAEYHGYTEIYLYNLFALVTSDPKVLTQSADPEGPENDQYLREIVGDVVVAWGAFKEAEVRGKEVRRILLAPLCFGVTKSGQPRHPLYLRHDTELVAYEGGKG